MSKSFFREIARRDSALTLVVLGLVAGLLALPFQLRTEAAKGLFERTASHGEGLPNYDIRRDKSAFEQMTAFRAAASKTAADVAKERQGFARGEEALRLRVPTLKVEYNADLRIPEVIGPDVLQGKAFLTDASARKRSAVLKDFLTQNSELIGATDQQIIDLKVVADYTNPDGNLSFVELNQEINEIPVFRGEVKAGFTKHGEIVRVINNFAPGLDETPLSTDFGDPATAVRAAAGHIGHELTAVERDAPAHARGPDNKVVFGRGDRATTAEKMYFPTEPGVAIPSWRVLIWQPVNAYYVIVDAASGTMLWRKNITEDQAQTATYEVYANPSAMINVADSPAPHSPGPVDPNAGTQGAIIARSSISRIGNEPPYTFDDLGWMTDGTNLTDGNNVEAGLDLTMPDGVDPGSQAIGVPNRMFTSAWNPPPGNPPPGDDLTTPEARRGGIIQMFWVVNWYHDETYRLGFTEPAHNFQHLNFGRGGEEGDRVSAEGQDGLGGPNNANFSAGTDGVRGRMQLYTWTGPTPDRDGMVDAEIMIHELTHGLSNRLHGNGMGLTISMSRALGEGWSDFYAHSMLSQESDVITGIHALGGYALFNAFGVVGTTNYYYGIRRFPKAIISSTGGPMNRPHNPLTFADFDQSQLNTADGAFSAMAGPHISTAADQVHAGGEIWSSALWEVRAKMVQRNGWAVGNRRALQVVTDGMKLAPLAPTFLNERDAIIAGALASGTAGDVADLWSGFAIRGLGASASIQNNGTGNGTARVTEAFDLPNLKQTPNLTITDSNGTGFPEPGENVTINIPITNSTGTTATGVTLDVVGVGSANYGTIPHGATVTQPVNYTVGLPCGSVVTLTLNVNSSLGPVSFARTFVVGQPMTTLEQNFDSVAAPAMPAGWTATPVSGGINFVTSTTTPDSAPNSAFALDPTTVGGGTDLTSPAIPINTSAATVTFRHRYDVEAGWDGSVLEVSIAGGAFQDILTAGGTFLQNGYTGTLGNGTNNPLANRPAWSGNSNGYVTTIARLPASANGQNVQLRWRFGADNNTAATGWFVDSIQVVGTYLCVLCSGCLPDTPADFDGDGKTDISVFRPAGGIWFINRSSDGALGGAQFGLSTDKIVPGDFTGDGKTDIAVWRPSGGLWFVLRSEDGVFYVQQFGSNGDVPAPADYDADGKADLAVFRPSNGAWFIQQSAGGTVIQGFGLTGDHPVAADYDGDGRADIAVWRPSGGTWWILRSSDGALGGAQFGLSTDKPVQGDYTGDGKTDIAVWRPSTGFWYVLRSEDSQFYAFPWGLSTDVPAPGDFDGDGRFDASVFRPSGGTWFVSRSTAGTLIQQFGAATDQPVPSAYVP